MGFPCRLAQFYLNRGEQGERLRGAIGAAAGRGRSGRWCGASAGSGSEAIGPRGGAAERRADRRGQRVCKALQGLAIFKGYV